MKNSETGRSLEVGEIRRGLYATLDVVLFMSERQVTEVYFDPLHARIR